MSDNITRDEFESTIRHIEAQLGRLSSKLDETLSTVLEQLDARRQESAGNWFKVASLAATAILAAAAIIGFSIRSATEPIAVQVATLSSSSSLHDELIREGLVADARSKLIEELIVRDLLEVDKGSAGSATLEAKVETLSTQYEQIWALREVNAAEIQDLKTLVARIESQLNRPQP